MRSYRATGLSGSMAAAAGTAEVFQFRWTNTEHFAVIRSVRINGFRASTAFAAGDVDIRLVVARSWTVDGSGGTTIGMTGNNGKTRVQTPSSLVGAIRVATTAGLSAGTKSLDSTDPGHIITHTSGGWNSATPIIGSIYLPTPFLLDPRECAHAPLVLSANEGFGVRFTVPGTGVWSFGVTVVWDEMRDVR